MQWSVKKKLISVVAIVTVNGYGGEILRVNGWVTTMEEWVGGR